MAHPPEPEDTDRTVSSTGPTQAFGPQSRVNADSAHPETPVDIHQAPADARVGKYIRVSRLGAGGMGEVWKAWDTELNRWVALKILKGTEEEELFRFRREAQTSARLVHPNIAAVYEAQERFIAMQFVDGMTLDEHPQDDLRALVGFVRQAAVAVHHAHRNGIIHRDIKPGNIMVTRQAEPHVYVMDFGLAKSTGVSSSVSVSGIVLGTPGYMSPEQARGKTDLMGPATDVYSLGATLYALLAHRPPFKNDNVYEVLREIVEEDPLPVRRRNPRVDLDLEIIVMKCLDKNPSNRYASAEDLGAELDRWLKGDPILARPVSTVALFLRSARRHKGLTIASGALALVVLLAGAALLIQDRAASRRAAAMRQLGTLWSTITERKRELRLLKLAPEKARQDLARGIEAIDAHIALWPEDPQGYYIRARGHLYLGNLPAADRDLRTAIAKQPEFRPAWSLLGMVKIERSLQLQHGTLDDGIEAVRKVQPVLVEAMEAFEKGWKTGAEQVEAERWGLAWTREDQVMERVARVQRCFADRALWPEARRLIQEGIDEFRAEEYAFYMSRTTIDQSQDEWVQRALDWAPGYDRALVARAQRRIQIGDYPGAIADLELAMRVQVDAPDTLFNVAYAHHQFGNRAEALRYYDRTLAVQPDHTPALVNRADVKCDLRDFDGALADLERAMKIEPDHQDCYYFRGMVRRAMDNTRGALEDFNRALELRSDSPQRLFSRAMLLQQMGRMREAEEDFGRAVGLNPRLVSAWTNRGAARGIQGNVAGALADFNHALGLNPNHVQSLVNRGTLYVQMGKAAEALADYGRAIEIQPKHAEAYSSRALLHHAQRNHGEAMKDFDRALSLDPNKALTLAGRATLRKDLRDYAAAMVDVDRALVLDPNLPEAYAIRGALRMIERNPAKGIEDFEAALKHAPPGWAPRAQVEHWLTTAKSEAQ